MLIEEKYRDLLKEGLEEGRIMGLKEGLEEGRAEGRTQGLAEGHAIERRMMQDLLRRMKTDGREATFLQAMEDDELMKSLYEEYGIAQE